MKRFVINQEKDINRCLIDFLVFNFQNITKSKLLKEIKKGNIKINKQKTSSLYILKRGDEINIYTRLSVLKLEKENLEFLKVNLNIPIVYEDDKFIVFNKPKNVLCQADKNERINTLNNFLKKYLYTKGNKKYSQANLVHRIDKDVSGLVLACLNKQLIRKISSYWNTEYISKYYIALLKGKINKTKGLIKANLMFDENLQKMVIDKNNIYKKEASLTYELIKYEKDNSLVKVKLLTGKKHQIRVLFANLNHPIIGEKKYSKDYKHSLCLISYEMKFNFPKEENNLIYLNNKKIRLDKKATELFSFD